MFPDVILCVSFMLVLDEESMKFYASTFRNIKKTKEVNDNWSCLDLNNTGWRWILSEKHLGYERALQEYLLK